MNKIDRVKDLGVLMFVSAKYFKFVTRLDIIGYNVFRIHI